MPSRLLPVVLYLAYHSMRCHTPSVTFGLLTFGQRLRFSPGNSVVTTRCRGAPTPFIMMNICPWPLWANMNAILLPAVLSCHGLLTFHQNPAYNSLVAAMS